MNDIELLSPITPKHFLMNPYTEDLIRSKELKNGMFVLVEPIGSGEDPTDHLIDPEHTCDNYRCNRMLRDQRWCKVTDLELRRNGELVSFIGWYADGTKQTRTYSESYNWFVKLIDSVGNFITDPREKD